MSDSKTNANGHSFTSKHAELWKFIKSELS